MSFADAARAIVDANRFMTLATADAAGRPWASPVWYAHRAYTDFVWVSKPGALHSRNLAARPEVGIVIFDSTVVPGQAEAVYVQAVARELDGAERDEAIAVFSRRSQAEGLGEWTFAEVTAPARHRLYGATARRHYILQANDERLEVDL
jgi:nitroimidazol reductase NimA-like FMN-containing flavoprotein (pyridoxamine 5'-phosphate oxidase superfamily)